MQRTARALTAFAVMVATVAAVVMAPPNVQPAGAATDRVDLIFAVDGSGSISAIDWQIQLDGIETALQDRSTIPLDGSVAVGVVQWATTSQVEVELTVIDDEDTVADLIGQIDAIDQLGGSTGPGLGLDESVDHFMAHQRDDADQVICMSTDGTRNTGPQPADSAEAAEAAGVETYSVLAIEDGGFTAATAHAYYGPLVFGGGSVTVARNATEFAAIIGNACFPSDTALVGLEVNQVIQNWNNDVAVYAEKDTVVRAFVESLDGDPVRITGRLRGYRGGSELPESPLPAANPGGSVFATDDNAERRDQRDASLNFELPSSWAAQGDLELRFEVPGGVECQEAAGAPNDCAVTAQFLPAIDMELWVVDVPWDDGTDMGDLDGAQLAEQARRVQDATPVSNLDFATRTLQNALDEKPDLGEVLRTLTRARAADGCGDDCGKYYYGAVEGSGGGLGYRPGVVSAGFISGVDGRDDTGYARNRVTHEVAHNLGIPHAADRDRDGAGANIQGPCGATAPTGTSPFPYINDVPGWGERGTLSDLGDRDAEVWGVAPRFFSGSDALFISSPYSTFELMGYCSANGQWRWPSVHTYEAMVQGLGGSLRPPSGGGGWLATGVVSGDGAELDPILALDVDDLPANTSGDDDEHELIVLDEDGDLIESVSFTPIEAHGDVDEPGGVEPAGALHFLVTITTPTVPVGAIVIERGGQVLGTFEASDHAPEVTITAPDPGQVFDDDTVTFSWEGTDADGDDLTYLVQYRPDEAAPWHTLATDLPATEITVDRADLEASSTARIRVVASDGIRTGEAVSAEFFTVDNNAPTVEILSPDDGERFSGVQQVLFRADAADADGDDLTVTWTSDLDGTLGTGDEVVRSADQLREGEHVITVTVSDGALEATDTITIDVVRVATPPPLPPTDPEPASVDRVAGDDRVATAVAASERQWADHDVDPDEDGRERAATAVLARVDHFADALVGTPLAVAGDGPLLLTSASALDDATGDELARVLAPGTDVIVLGGTSALGDEVLDDLEARGFAARRVAGADRYDTAVQVARELGDPSDVLVSTGADFADAVFAGAAAAHISAAVLLSAGDDLPVATAEYLDGRDVTVVAVGGPATRALPQVEGVAGADRYETSVAVAERFFDEPAVVGVATGESFPDSLSGGAVVARHGGPILLTPSSGLPDVVAQYLQAVSATLVEVVVLGGSDAVSLDVESQIHDVVGDR